MAARLSDRQKKRIIADYVEKQSYNAVAKKHKVAATTVKRVVQADRETKQNAEQKKKENTQDILAYMEGRKDVVCEIIGRGLDVLNSDDKLESANPQQITTALGTLIDKFTGNGKPHGDDESRFFDIPARLIARSFADTHRDVLDKKYTEYLEKGGRGSGKSSWISLEVVQLIKNNPQLNALCCRKVGNTLRDSVFSQILWAIDVMGLSEEFESHVSPMEISCKATGQKIYFRGADDPIKLKSIKPKSGYIGVLWFEELDQFSGDEEVRSITQSVIRGGDDAYIFKSFNPRKEKANWANKYAELPKPGRKVSHSTYEEVPPEWLGKAFLDEAEFIRSVNPKAYANEYKGEANGTGGMVFENLVAETIPDALIAGFDRTLNGLDWGYYPDPWAFNRVHYDAARMTLYIFDELTEYKKGNKATAELLIAHGLGREDIITADSAEPKSVADYRKLGLNKTMGAIKGPDSVNYSMKWLQSLVKIVIDPVRCPDTYDEFSNYEYERTRDGEIISGYPDANNHHIDAVRYATEKIWRRAGQPDKSNEKYVPLHERGR